MTSWIKIVLAVAVMGIAYCQSPPDEIKTVFDEVNVTLSEANAALATEPDKSYNDLLKIKRLDTATAAAAREWYETTIQLRKRINTIIMDIKAGDEAGTDSILATRILTQTIPGKALTSTVKKWLKCAGDYSIDSTRQNELDEDLSKIRDMLGTDESISNYFGKTPTAGAITILHAAQSHIRNAATGTSDCSMALR